MVEIATHLGESIDNAAVRLVQAADEHGEATAKFNDIELFAAKGFAAEGVVRHYMDEVEKRSRAWRASPEGRRVEQERETRRSEMQAKHDNLVRRLPSLDMSNDVAVLEWLCQMQEPSDHTGVILQRQNIVSKFEAAGYKPNENTGDDFRKDNRANVFRYLVGQALAGLKEGPAIHGILHSFAADWRRDFVEKPALNPQKQEGGA